MIASRSTDATLLSHYQFDGTVDRLIGGVPGSLVGCFCRPEECHSCLFPSYPNPALSPVPRPESALFRCHRHRPLTLRSQIDRP